MNAKHLLVVTAACAIAATARSQVTITEQQSADKSASRETVTVRTMDRSYVPLVIETKDTKVDAQTTRSESVTRARLNDGSYFDWQRSTTVTRQVDPNRTEAVTDIVETDRQGATRTTRQVAENVAKTSTGEQANTSVRRRDSSGNLVLEGETVSTTTKQPDGSLSVVRVEKHADVGGTLRPERQI